MGSWWSNPWLADTYETLLAAAGSGGSREQRIERVWRAFYEGFVADAIGKFCADTDVADSSGRSHRGLLTAQDMASWQARFEAPATLDYHGITVCKTDTWGQGPVMLQMLALLKGFDLASLDPNGAEFIHLWVEAAKLAFADRDAFYGDPDFVDVPLTGLLSEEYNTERRKLIGDAASADMRPGTVAGRTGRLPHIATPTSHTLGVGEPTAMAAATRAGDTCHIDVIDRWGNMVSATPSGGWLQSSPVIPDARLSPRHARADVLAGAWAARQPRAGQATSHDADTVIGTARWQAMARIRHARR